MTNYYFKVSIMGLPKVHRIIDATENCTFEDLHDAIYRAFDRYDEHLYSFFITLKDTKGFQTIYNAPEITSPLTLQGSSFFQQKKSASKVLIKDIGFKAKDVFHYLFDYGDKWWHRIRVEKIVQTLLTSKQIKTIEIFGKSPPQYPDEE